MAKQFNGTCGSRPAPRKRPRASRAPKRLGLPYVDLNSFRVDAELFRSIPVDLMLKYSFVPESRTEKVMTIICADPADVVRLDELEMLVGVPLRLKVGVGPRSRTSSRSRSRPSGSSTRPPRTSTSSSSRRTRTARRP